MKKALFLLCFAPFALSCGSDSGAAKTKTTYTLAEDDPTALNTDSTEGADVSAVARQPQVNTAVTKIGTEPEGGAVALGAKLIENSNCTTCHRLDMQLIGPAYQAVAEKYPDTDANVTMLANRVIKGGVGHWGEIAMTAHPELSEQDSKTMVRYILSLK